MLQPLPTNQKESKIYLVMMILCFFYAGISLLLLAFHIFAFFQFDQTSQHFVQNAGEFSDSLISNSSESDNLTTSLTANYFNNGTSESNSFIGRSSPETRRALRDLNFTRNRVQGFFYIQLFASMLGVFISLFAGVSLLMLTRKQSTRHASQKMIDMLTTEEEKTVISVLTSAGGTLTQSELVMQTGLTKVKIHRILRRLESLSLIERFPYGMTNKIVLKNK